MKIRVSFVVDIDAEAWAIEYGLDRAEVRADVKDHIAESVLADLDTKGLLEYPTRVSDGNR